MAGTYTYDPSQISGGVNRMRFELGDTIVEGGKATAALCDEEYAQMISEHPTNWKRAKLKLQSRFKSGKVEADAKRAEKGTFQRSADSCVRFLLWPE